MGLVKMILSVVGILLLAVVGLGAYLWFTDYEAAGTVTEKGRDAQGDYIVIEPRLLPREIRHPIDAQAAQFVCEGYEVTYRIQSGVFRVLDEQGRVVYDSTSGLTTTGTFSPVRCADLV